MSTNDSQKPAPGGAEHGNARKGADELLALALASGSTLKEAAKTAGVSYSTGRRRNDDPVFRARVAELRNEMLSQATGTLAAGLSTATLPTSTKHRYREHNAAAAAA